MKRILLAIVAAAAAAGVYVIMSKAVKPDEVGTLVISEWGRTGTRAYSSSTASPAGIPSPVSQAPALTTPPGARAVYLKIYDMKNKMLVGRWLLEGQPPPDSLELSEIDKIPGPPLAAFLTAMPAK